MQEVIIKASTLNISNIFLEEDILKKQLKDIFTKKALNKKILLQNDLNYTYLNLKFSLNPNINLSYKPFFLEEIKLFILKRFYFQNVYKVALLLKLACKEALNLGIFLEVQNIFRIKSQNPLYLSSIIFLKHLFSCIEVELLRSKISAKNIFMNNDASYLDYKSGIKPRAYTKNMKQDKKIAIISGASSGLGLELGISLSRAGYKVFSLSRNAKMHEDIEFIKCDVGNLDDLIKAFKYISLQGRVDLLINNSGYAYVGLGIDIDIKSLDSMLDINVFGLYLCTLICAKFNSGFLNVSLSSMGAILNLPFHASYCSSKLAILPLIKELSVKRDDIRFLNIFPGNAKTNFSSNKLIIPTSKEFIFLDKNFKSSLEKMQKDEGVFGYTKESLALKVHTKIMLLIKKYQENTLDSNLKFFIPGIQFLSFAMLSRVTPKGIKNLILYFMYGR